MERAHALFLIRTPFQAFLAGKVRQAEGIRNYDLLYFTHNDTAEDRRYFESLAGEAAHRKYIFTPPHRMDIFNHLAFAWQTRGWWHDGGYTRVVLASIDSFVINAIASRQGGAELITFDDGTANYFPLDRYRIDQINRRGRLYRRLFGTPSLEEVKARIARHYTVHPEFENITVAEKLRHLSLAPRDAMAAAPGTLTFFIGQPFEEMFSPQQIERLTAHFRSQHIDFYVRHPRERRPIELGAPILDKQGRIAEDAIVAAARGDDIRLLGSFSSVMFNMPSSSERTIALPLDSASTASMSDLSRRAGCRVILL